MRTLFHSLPPSLIIYKHLPVQVYKLPALHMHITRNTTTPLNLITTLLFSLSLFPPLIQSPSFSSSAIAPLLYFTLLSDALNYTLLYSTLLSTAFNINPSSLLYCLLGCAHFHSIFPSLSFSFRYSPIAGLSTARQIVNSLHSSSEHSIDMIHRHHREKIIVEHQKTDELQTSSQIHVQTDRCMNIIWCRQQGIAAF